MTVRRDVSHEQPERVLKMASRDLIKAAGGTDGAAATLTALGSNVRQQRISDCQHATTDRFLRLHEVGRLEDVAVRTEQWPHITRALADRHGFDLVPRDTVLPANADWCAALAKAVNEFGDVQEKILKALPEGITAAEVRDAGLTAEIDQAIRALRTLRQLAERAEDDSS